MNKFNQYMNFNTLLEKTKKLSQAEKKKRIIARKLLSNKLKLSNLSVKEAKAKTIKAARAEKEKIKERVRKEQAIKAAKLKKDQEKANQLDRIKAHKNEQAARNLVSSIAKFVNRQLKDPSFKKDKDYNKNGKWSVTSLPNEDRAFYKANKKQIDEYLKYELRKKEEREEGRKKELADIQKAKDIKLQAVRDALQKRIKEKERLKKINLVMSSLKKTISNFVKIKLKEKEKEQKQKLAKVQQQQETEKEIKQKILPKPISFTSKYTINDAVKAMFVFLNLLVYRNLSNGLTIFLKNKKEFLTYDKKIEEPEIDRVFNDFINNKLYSYYTSTPSIKENFQNVYGQQQYDIKTDFQDALKMICKYFEINQKNQNMAIDAIVKFNPDLKINKFFDQQQLDLLQPFLQDQHIKEGLINLAKSINDYKIVVKFDPDFEKIQSTGGTWKDLAKDILNPQKKTFNYDSTEYRPLPSFKPVYDKLSPKTKSVIDKIKRITDTFITR